MYYKPFQIIIFHTAMGGHSINRPLIFSFFLDLNIVNKENITKQFYVLFTFATQL